MPDNRVAPASHFAMAAADEVSAPDKGIASRATEPSGGGAHGAAFPRAGGDTPAGRRRDAALAAHPQSKNVAPTPRNTAPGSAPGAKTFPGSCRVGLGVLHKAYPH